MDILKAIILGIVEGLTEFLPVSSTGHLILAERVLGLDGDQAPWSILLWVSQFAAILAVILYFWRDLWRRIVDPLAVLWRRRRGRAVGGGPGPQNLAAIVRDNLLTKLIVAMIPTVVLAVLLKKHLDVLETMPLAVAGALIVGAVIMEFIDRRFRRQMPQDLSHITLPQAFLIGLIQCVSMWPGVSRAAATIMGGMCLGLTPRVATEFSFYLAIPTMLGATIYTLKKHWHELGGANMGLVFVGSATAFLMALLVVATFLGYVRRYRFTPFVVYRVLLGALVMVCYFVARG